MSAAVIVHVLSVVIWVGGMFFAYMCLRPAAVELLEPPLRLRLWVRVFERFFPWVWAAVALILATGLWIIAAWFQGFANAPRYVHIMFGLGLIMMLIFFHVFFAPYQRLRRAVMAEEWPVGGKALSQIRLLVGINTAIGLLTVIIASGGRYLVP